ncbi:MULTISPECIES: L,D-transpeptidase [unclassified Corynebacterium]|uniref:L,D-transpeptidase n=1 Tax=unclassified Corynebacterium TaxID=2624378 RepID=UPI0029CA98CE|nr:MULTISPECIES: L,D-transpeptidase [unclassified Corynebacterium]WPF66508.1 L,D-transpeptidase [Corynebacterium sp. 22KM0430]WPF68997.1 L,D-transpeptidase [Corynebacterium sp. 21KM1197]
MSYKPRHAKPSATRRRAVSLAAAGTATGALLASPSIASAAENNPAPATLTWEDQALEIRNALHEQAALLPPELADPALQLLDNSVETAFPGLIGQPEQAPAVDNAAEDAAVQEAARAEEQRRVEAEQAEAARRAEAERVAAQQQADARAADLSSTPCPAEARACIDLQGNRTWLQENGEVTYGPVIMSAGAPSPETATPTGTFYVNRKVKDEVSYEFDMAPMPYAVYFTNNGIAFHEGDPALLSHGCIHLNHDDAVQYFDQLQIGDMVYVY